MADLVLKNCKVSGNLTDIEISDGKISKIGVSNLDGTDLKGKKVYPGLIDIHTHGLFGYDTMDGDKLSEMSKHLIKYGVTSYLPTTMTMDLKDIKKAISAEIPQNGSEVLGFHLEGPYISEKFKGSQNSKYIKNPDQNDFSEFNNIKMITLAPELPGSKEFIRNSDAIISIGHTDCNYERAVSAIESGAKCLTHTFNAMPPLNHREPGPIGAAFSKNIFIQVICDGVHIHPAVIKMLYKLFGKERMILISDSMRAAGLTDGKYTFGGQEITVTNGIARTSYGAIAGSTSTLLDCVKKAVSFSIPESDAFYMATKTPAALLNLNKGIIKVGFDADLIVLDDNLNLTSVIKNGKAV